jgi:ubiquinone/menaquinone biosynthesis C-methylase UbiE
MDLREKWNISHRGIPGNKDVSKYAVESEKKFGRRSRVCDVGGGIGVDAIYFAIMGHSVVNVDVSDVALKVSKNRAIDEKLSNFEVQVVELGSETLPFADETFDVVYSRLALHYFTQRQSINIFKELNRILKGGGKTFVVVKSPEDEREMEYLMRTAKVVEPGVFNDGGDIKNRFSKGQWNTILKDAGIEKYSVESYEEILEGRIDKIKSGASSMLLNEIRFEKV